MKNEVRVCVVNYKTGWLNGRLCYGHAFDSLVECCEDFREAFWATGNKKSETFGDGSLYENAGSGLSLVIQGGEIKVLLAGRPIGYCPWCGSKVEVRQSKKVLLVPKTETVQVGFTEKPLEPVAAR